MNFVNLMNENLRVLRNPSNPDDHSWMIFPSQARNFNVDFGEGALSGTASSESVIDNCYVLEVVRDTRLPAPAPDTVYIVPMNIALAAVGRNDLVFPDQPIIRRDSQGNELPFNPQNDGYGRLCHAIDA